MPRVLLTLSVWLIAVGELAFAQDVPRTDHHQHLFSPALAALLSPAPPASPVTPITARDVVAHLDRAGIARAVVLSTAYIFEQPTRKVEDASAKARAENDWTAEQVAQFPTRLVGFCGLNPLTDYAVAELTRCAGNAHLSRGVKLHLGNSEFDFHNPEHIDRLRRLFKAANDRRMAIVVHMRASYSLKRRYGRDEALIFLKELLPAAPDVVVQIAHLGGGGGPNDQASYDALEVLASAVAAVDPRTRQLYFDVTGIGLLPNLTSDEASMFTARLRQLGVGRILFGSDAASGGNPPPREQWEAFRKLPLGDDEFRTIATNVAPYLR